MNDNKKFQELLIKAIGERNKSVFAAAAGMTKEYISRALREDFSYTPSRKMLKKIAGASERRVGYTELLEACGYDVETALEEDMNEKFDRSGPAAVSKAVEDFIEGFTIACAKGNRYESVEDLADYVYTLWGSGDVKFTYGAERDFGDSAHKDADCSMLITISQANPDGSSFILEVVVWYMLLQKNGICTVGASFDPATLMRSGSGLYRKWYKKEQPAAFSYSVEDEAEKWISSKSKAVHSRKGNMMYMTVSVVKEDRIYEYTLVAEDKTTDEQKQAHEEKIKEYMERGMSREEAEKAALLGDPDVPRKIKTMEGIGFYLDEIDDAAIAKFLITHGEAFARSDGEMELAARVLEQEPLDKVFKTYKPDITAPAFGKFNVILNVMIRETGYDFYPCGFCLSKEYMEKYGNKPCIMLQMGMFDWDMDMIGAILGYAAELGTDTAGAVHFNLAVKEEKED